jgi:hypothetical protein
MPDDDSLSQEALDALLAELGEIDTGDPAPQPTAMSAEADLAEAVANVEPPPVAVAQAVGATPPPPNKLKA